MTVQTSDFDLLQKFSRQGDQGAFATLVRRHLNLVYGTALRKVADSHVAEEIAQNVFTVLARKCWRFAPDDSVPAWLHKTTLLEAQQWWRGEMRRRRREETAAQLGTTNMTSPDHSTPSEMLTLLDDALLTLRDKERAALLVRFHEGRSLREVGETLGCKEDAAQKRVASALDKLTSYFRRHGFKTASAAMIAGFLQQSCTTASAATTSAVIGAVAQLAPPAASGFLLARLFLLSRVQTTLLCAAIATVPIAKEWSSYRATKEELRVAEGQLETLEREQGHLRIVFADLLTQAERYTEEAEKAESAQQEAAKVAEDLSILKRRVQGLLTPENYAWPEDLAVVRIPKSAIYDMDIEAPLKAPGLVPERTRELLGLTPRERKALEEFLAQHFARVYASMEQNIYVTNRIEQWNEPPAVLASHMLVMPRLQEAQESAEHLLARLPEILGEDRWKVLKAELKPKGFGTLHYSLGIESRSLEQRIVVWIYDTADGQKVGLHSQSGGSQRTYIGTSLDVFANSGDQVRLEEVFNQGDFPILPEPLYNRAIAWLHSEAAQRLSPQQNP